MRLAVTGLGLVSPLGVGREAWERALSSPEDARAAAFRGPSEVLDTERVPDSRTAEVWGWDPKVHLGKKGHRTFDRLTKFLIAAAGYALDDARIKEHMGDRIEGAPTPHQIGICSATAYGSLDAITELNRVAELEDPRYINPSRFPNTVINAAAGYVSIWQDLRAPNTTLVDGNCGALDAVLSAETHLRNGRGRAFLVGGGEVVSEPLYLALAKLGVVARADRPGLEVGEGACYMVVESPEPAAERGARILGELRGYGTAFEPPTSEALLVHTDPAAVERAIEGALGEAGVPASAIGAVSAAQCGLEEMDAAERAGIAAALGDDVAVVATKRLHGETFGAAGAFGCAAALAWLDGAPLGPLVAGRAPERVDHVVVLTVGFYGNVSAVVISRFGTGDRKH